MEQSEWLTELREHELREESRLDSLHEKVTRHDGLPTQMNDVLARLKAVETQLANLNVGLRFLIWLGGSVIAGWTIIEKVYDHIQVTFR